MYECDKNLLVNLLKTTKIRIIKLFLIIAIDINKGDVYHVNYREDIVFLKTMLNLF